jgi:nitroreductase
MTFLELAKKRYSVRNYDLKEIEPEKLSYILECGRIAPSAANFQPWHIVVVTSEELKKKLHETYERDWFMQAPVILVFLGDHRQGWKRGDGKDHTDIDVSIIIDHITLAAAEQGLGTCWICNFNTERCGQILNLPDHLEPIAYLPLGYPSDSTDSNVRHLKRKAIEEIVKFEK